MNRRGFFATLTAGTIAAYAPPVVTATLALRSMAFSVRVALSKDPRKAQVQIREATEALAERIPKGVRIMVPSSVEGVDRCFIGPMGRLPAARLVTVYDISRDEMLCEVGVLVTPE